VASKTIEAAGGIVVRKGAGGLIAVVQRSKDDAWVLPRGKLKRDEDPVAGARREVVEETGHRVEVHEYLGAITYRAGGRPKVVQFWRMEADAEASHELMPDIVAVDWLPLKAAVRRLSYPLEKLFLRHAIARALKKRRATTQPKTAGHKTVGAKKAKPAKSKPAKTKTAKAKTAKSKPDKTKTRKAKSQAVKTPKKAALKSKAAKANKKTSKKAKEKFKEKSRAPSKADKKAATQSRQAEKGQGQKDQAGSSTPGHHTGEAAGRRDQGRACGPACRRERAEGAWDHGLAAPRRDAGPARCACGDRGTQDHSPARARPTRRLSRAARHSFSAFARRRG